MAHEKSLVGPGRYSPQRRDDIGGSEMQKSRNAMMYSTLTATKDGSGPHFNNTKRDSPSVGKSGEDFPTGELTHTLNQSFGSST